MAVSYGGQAVLEGVMMRSPSSWAVAIRTPEGDITEVIREISSPMQRRRIWRLPVIRGVIALGESLAIGFRALAISANVASQERDEDGEIQTQISRGQIIFSFAIAIGFALMLFKIGPALLTNWLPIESTGLFVVVEGLIRVAVFIGYILLISLLPDLRRVFQYHGAEHKAISTYEAHEDLRVENARRKTTMHPRCGTTFLVMVALVSIVVFTAVGSFLPRIPGPRVVESVGFFFMKLPFLPLIAAITFEIQRLFARFCTVGPLRALLWPGFLVQKITTAEPDDKQLEVALGSLLAALGMEEERAKAAQQLETNKNPPDRTFPDYEKMLADPAYSA